MDTETKIKIACDVRLDALRLATMEPHKTTEELVDTAELLIAFILRKPKDETN